MAVTLIPVRSNKSGEQTYSKRNSTLSYVLFTILVRSFNHTVLLTWSTQTGKVVIHLDGNEVDFDDCKGYSIIQRKIESRELGLNFELLATRVAPLGAASDFLCYECIINGQAFSQLPQKNDNRLIMSTADSMNGQPHLVTDGDSYSTSEQEEEDAATPYSLSNLRSVVDIVYPNGIPSSE